MTGDWVDFNPHGSAKLLRKYGPTAGRLACGFAGTLLAILCLVLTR